MPVQATGAERAGTYLRVSTGQQVEKGYGLPEQSAKTRERCEQRRYRVVEEVRDEGISGRLEERPGLQRLLDLAKTQAIDTVVAVNIKRLGRENRIIQDVLRRVRSYGVRVEFVEHASGEAPAERLMENLLGSFSEFEWETIRLATMNGRERKAREKRAMPNGKAPFGYRCITKAQAAVLPEYRGRDGEFLIVDEEAVIVRELFRRAAQGETLGTLARWIGEQAGGRMGSRAAIGNALRNTAYIGRPQFKKTSLRQVDGKKVRRRRPEEERIDLQCPALVPEELFATVGARLTQNRETLRGRPPVGNWPLRGCVVCGLCVTPQRGAPRACIGHAKRDSRGEWRYYHCRTEIGGCGVSHRADDLEELARLALIEAASPGRLADLERQRAKRAAAESGDPEAEIREARRELEKLDREEEQVADLALQGFSAAVVQKKLAGLNERRRALQERLTAAQGAIRSIEPPDRAAARGEAAAKRLRADLADPEKFAELVRSFLTIRISPDKPPVIEVRVPASVGGAAP